MQQTMAILERLVSFDTTSHRSNLDLITYVREYLDEHGVTSHLFPSKDGRKANLFATLGPAGRRGIMLSGHSDVVPAEPARWSSDPFKVDHRDGRCYGRGTADMKGFIAATLAAVPHLAAAKLDVPVHIALTYDEEIGCLGAPHLIEGMKSLEVQPRLCIVGEPTGMQVAVGHKGARAYHVVFKGKSGHSSRAPLMVNAVEHAAELVVRLTGLAREFETRGPFNADYDIPHTSVHTGVFNGGTQVNIVPAQSDVEFEFRPLPEADADGIEGRIRHWIDDEIGSSMQNRFAECGATLTRRYGYPGLDTNPQDPIVQAINAMTGSTRPIWIAFGTEAGLFHTELGMTTVVCGPGYISDAHQPDEFVSEEQLKLCEVFLDKLCASLANDDLLTEASVAGNGGHYA